MPDSTSKGKNLVLAAMIFAVSMTFIDQTIVSIAVPELQKDLGLTATGVQWVVNGYLLSLAALFAFGGKLADTVGHKTMVLVGVVIFAAASALCGATPTGAIAEPWIITFRVIEGAGAALMFPAALAIVVGAFPLRERGKAMATFFGIAGGLTAVGPIAGGYLSEWTWRAIFWVNIPVAIIAIVLTLRADPPQNRRPAPLDYRGLVLVTGGMGLAVLGLQQSTTWGWDSVGTWGSIIVGLALLAAFVPVELHAEHPLVDVRIFAGRAFTMENVVLAVVMVCFVPFFFFASMYAQISLGDDSSSAGIYLLWFFIGYAIASQIGGRILDKRGARAAIVPGCALGAVGFYFLAQALPDLDFNDQRHWVAIAGAGLGLIVGPASTDVLNRAPSGSYGEITGITQTLRNFGSSLGLALLGSLLISRNTANVEDSLGAAGIPKGKADEIAHSLTSAGGGDQSSFAGAGGAQAQRIFEKLQTDFAQSTKTVFTVMAAVMALAYIVAVVGVPKGRVEAADDEEGEQVSQSAAPVAPA